MNLYDLRDEFNKSGVMMCFNGPFCHSIIEEIGKAVRKHLTAENITQAVLMEVFAVYIELTQNVRNYLITRKITGPDRASSIITIGRSGEGYVVSSGNVVLNADVEKLCSRIDEVNAMTHDEIKVQYRKQMRCEAKPDAVGAGLGFLDIAKRSSEKMTYSVKDLDTTSKFFTLSAYI